jgi:cytidylate kinase
MIVAIDGPAASGKSTVARALARRLGLAYLDTGAMYRAVGVEALRRGTGLEDAAALTSLANEVTIRFEHDEGSALPTRVLVDDRDVTDAIRTPEADIAVSPVSKTAGVREAMVAQQRRIADEAPSTVLEGRDIGTVVFPDAEVKVYLTASAEERARRRAIDMMDRGVEMTVAEVREKLVARDLIDSTREISPLTMAADAVEIDTTGMRIDEVVAAIAALVEARKEAGE